jgi:hypothetical protein
LKGRKRKMAIRERIKELVSEIQKAYVFGSVTGKYTCSKHKRFLELVEVKVYLSVGSPNQLVGERVCTVWKCPECGSAILEVAEEIN